MSLNKIINEALKEHYREGMERKRVPSDYLLMFTEGGESNAVASAVLREVGKYIERHEKELDSLNVEEQAERAYDDWQIFKETLLRGELPK